MGVGPVVAGLWLPAYFLRREGSAVGTVKMFVVSNGAHTTQKTWE